MSTPTNAQAKFREVRKSNPALQRRRPLGISYVDFMRFAETRLAQHSLDYLNAICITLK